MPQTCDVSKVTRVEVIDHREPFGEIGKDTGRVYSAWGCNADLSLQDGGRTLKIFIGGKRAGRRAAPNLLGKPEGSQG